MKRILILTNHGMGLFNFRKELLESLLEQKYEVFVSFPKDEYSTMFEKMGCHFIDTQIDRRGMNPFKDLKTINLYLRIMKETKPDMVLTYTIKPNLYGSMCSRFKKIPYINTVTGLGTSLQGGGIMSKILLYLYKVAFKKSKMVFFQNKVNYEFMKQQGIKINNHKIVNGSGVNIDRFKVVPYPIKQEEDKINLLYIGRIMKEKGINELLEAVQSASLINKIHLNMVGFPEEDYSEILDDLSKQKVITFHGKQKDVMPFIEENDALILPSHHEGMSNVLQEAAAMGRPLLASNIPGCNDIIEHGYNGLLFEPNSSSSISNSILSFLKLTHQEREKMGLNGRNKIEKDFNRNNVVKEYIKEITDILEG